MNEPRRPQLERPFPDVRTAFLLTIGAILAGGFVGFLFIDLGLIAAEGLGTAIGVGGVATLAARRVAEPQGLRIGLAGLDWRALPLIFCLAPAVLLASELDNFAYDWSPKKVQAEVEKTEANAASAPETAPVPETRDETGDAKPETGTETGRAAAAASAGTSEDGDAAAAAPTESTTEPGMTSEESVAPSAADGPKEPKPGPAPATVTKPASVAVEEETPEPLLDPNDPFNLMEAFIVSVGIAPVIHEFLFRGVIQQGLIGHLGFARGITLTALLWTMVRPVPSTSPARFAAAFIAFFAMGWLLGIVRSATGSILGPILLASLWAAVGFASVALDGRTALPGMNVEGTHLPIAMTLLSAAVVAWAAQRVYEVALRRPALGAAGADRAER
ncbi:MAG: CPBP family intramembrane metalloprotease [Deltaproteobacteria bacterium]|nr:CPBP family intramembrane metalloprotease [Deltaproteobacteria bacterium]